MNAWVQVEGCAVPADGTSGGIAPVVQQKTQTLYYVAAAGQTSFPVSVADLFGNSYVLIPTTSIAVTRGGLRVALDDGSGTGGYIVDTVGNSIHLLWPAGAGEIIVLDFFWEAQTLVLPQTIGQDVLTVTAPNVLSHLTRTPNGVVLILYVEGKPFFATVPAPAFTYAGNVITWISTVYSLAPGNEVVALYTS